MNYARRQKPSAAPGCDLLPVSPRTHKLRGPHNEPLRILGPTEHKQTQPHFVGSPLNPQAQWIECPFCGKTFTSAAVVNDPPEHNENAGGFVVHRRMLCDHCNILIIWQQPSNADGSKLQNQVLMMGIEKRGEIIDPFIRAHPEAAGVLQ
jgi:hypothetical protein